jgi:nucleolar protein 6
MAEAKLTKKQRKTKAFRASDDVEKTKVAKSEKGKAKAKEVLAEEGTKEVLSEGKLVQGKAKPAEQPSKKRKREDGIEASSSTSIALPTKKNAEGRRYIVFVGNMAFKTTSEQIAKHFHDHCGETPSVRLLTSKADPAKTSTLSKSKQKSIAKGKAQDPNGVKSKGCAFVEFTSPEALQKALQFHHTALHGRTINVELTAGGGGKGAERKGRIEKKNSNLEEERRKLHEKYVKPANASAKKAKTEDNSAAEKMTGPAWGPNARKSSSGGGGRQSSKPKPPPRWAASGANAVRLNG